MMVSEEDVAELGPQKQRDGVSGGQLGQEPEGNLWTDMVTVVRVWDPKNNGQVQYWTTS